MKQKRVFWGITLILAAIFLIVSKLGFLEDYSAFSLIFTVFLGAIIIKSIYPPNFTGILFPLAGLGILYDKQLGIESLTPWTLLIGAALASIGLSMIFRPKYYNHYRYTANNRNYNQNKNTNKNQDNNTTYNCNYSYNDDFVIIDEEDGSFTRHETNFGASAKYINTDDFKEAEVSCNFGAIKIYLDKANMRGETATLIISGNFCGIEIYVPKTWGVDNQLSVVMAGITESNRNYPDGLHTLVLKGEINLSGISIIYI